MKDFMNVRGQYVLPSVMVENCTDPLTPLTADLLEMLLPGTVSIRGWLYVNLKYILPFLPFKLSEEELAKMLLENKIFLTKFSLLKLPLVLLLIVYTYFVFGVSFVRAGGMPDGFLGMYRKLCQKVEEDPSFGPMETMQRLLLPSKIFEPVGNMVFIADSFVAFHILWMSLLSKLIQRWLPDLRDDAEALLCSGMERVLAKEMCRGIWALVREANDCKRIRELFLTHNLEELLSKFNAEPEARNFIVQLQGFLAENGHRALEELELRSPRWEEDPRPVLGIIRNFLQVESDPTDREEKVAQARAELEVEIRQKLEKYPLEQPLKLRWRLLRFIVNRIKYSSKTRENARFYYTIAIQILRKKLLKVGAELLHQGRLKNKDDIFFLLWGEIVTLQIGQLDCSDVEDRIRERRSEHAEFFEVLPPRTLGIQIPEEQSSKKLTLEDSMLLRGKTASPGQYEGIAHVVLKPSVDIELKPGEILVVPYLDPVWAPLFLISGAVVVEVGSFPSHIGTIAREYGMPCLVDVPECTKRIQTGDRINVDGESGIVRVISSRQ